MKTLLVFASVIAVGLCAGGWSYVSDPSSNEWCDRLMALDTQYNLISLPDGCPQIVSVQEQVVAGMNYRYVFIQNGQTCMLEYYERAWMKERTINKDNCSVAAKHGSARQLLGGYTDQDPSATEFQQVLVDFTAAGELKATNGYNIVKVETQVVSGINYRYTLSNGNGHTCLLVLYYQAWTSTRQVTLDECHLGVHKRQIPGGYTVQDPSDVMYQNLLVNFTNVGLLKPQAANDYVIKKIETQVVSGVNYRYTLSNGNGHECVMVLYVQSWTQTMRVTTDDCHMSTHMKRQLGAWQAVNDLNEAGVQACVGVMLDQINQQSNSMYRLVETGVSSQYKVVQGIEYKITLTAMESTCMNSGDSTGFTSTKCPVNAASNMMGSEWSCMCWYKAWETDPADQLKVMNLHMATSEDINQSGDPAYKVNSSIPDAVVHLKKVLNNKVLLGSDSHDYQIHGNKLLGRDKHDFVKHMTSLQTDNVDKALKFGRKLLSDPIIDAYVDKGKKLLGQDGHDLVGHLNRILGQDGHDLVDHAKNLLGGGDDHDLVNHVKDVLGQDGHDLVNHGVDKLLGQDGHDLVNHITQNLIGGDGHDYANHGTKNLIGGDGHDYANHGTKNLIGGDGHDNCHIGMFKEFQAKFSKIYGSQKEEEKRFYVFCQNMGTARKLQQTEKGTAKYGATKFADLTKEEFKQYVGKPWNVTANYWMKKAAIPKWTAPEAFDWRDHGAVTPVKNQGSCGSCWAFSTTGNIEGQWAIKKSKLVSLSEQELVDCDKVDEGCNGGLPSNAYKEIERLGGLETETDYSYKGEDEKCEFKKKEVKVYINDSVSISSDENEMASWLAANGPISIGINAFAMQFYMGGISHPWKLFCNPKNLDHGVLIVGYGVQDSEPYWIVKNSWGPDWGEKGYYLVYRGSGVCGLNTMCTSAVVN